MKKTTHKTLISPDGKPYSVPNDIAKSCENFYISYNNYDISIYGCDTTALVVTGKGSRFFILDGDHTKQLKDKSFKDCIHYLHSNKSRKNSMSEDFPPLNSSIQSVIDSPDPAMQILNKIKTK